MLTLTEPCLHLYLLLHFFLGTSQQLWRQVLLWSLSCGEKGWSLEISRHLLAATQAPEVVSSGFLPRSAKDRTHALYPEDENSQTQNIRVPELGMAARGMILSIGWSVFRCWFTQQEFLKLLLYLCACHCPWNTHTGRDTACGSLNLTTQEYSTMVMKKYHWPQHMEFSY